MDERARREAAGILVAAERDRRPVAPLTAQFDGFAVDDAYAVQLANVQERVAAGRRVVGHKVGLTAKAMQEMLGVDEPDYGHLLDDMVVADGATMPVDRYLQPRVEIEIAFVLKEPLAGPSVTVDDVLKATAYLVPSIEIIDSRIANWQITLADTVADNGSSAGLVLGSQSTPADRLDLPAVVATMRINGEVAATGTGEAVLGHPAAAVAWLANKLSELGVELQPGHIVLPGSCTKAIDVRSGDRVEALFEGLGSVSVVFS